MPPTDPRPSCSLPDDFGSPAIPGLRIPEQFYWIKTDLPPLAGMQLPLGAIPWEELFQNGFRWIACLCSERPFYDPSPLRLLVAVELCDLAEVDLPEDPEKEEESIGIIADAVVGRLEKGEGVIIHCAGGRGRTGTVIGVVLRKLGLPATEIVDFLDRVHRERGKPGWPESKWQSEIVARAG